MRALLLRHHRAPLGRSVRLRCCPLEDRMAPATFQGLGFLPGSTNYSGVTGVSADGSVAVGSSNVNGSERASRWTAATGMVDLGLLPGAGDADSSGRVGGRLGRRGLLLRLQHGRPDTCIPLDRDDGNGRSRRHCPERRMPSPGTCRRTVRSSSARPATRAFRWTATTGMIGLGLPAGVRFPEADGCFRGWLGHRGDYYGGSNYFWRFAGRRRRGSVFLGTAPGDANSSGRSVSAGGSVVVGEGSPDGAPTIRRSAGRRPRGWSTWGSCPE